MIKKVIIAGAGHRSLCYAGYAQTAPDKMQIVGVAEPIKERRDFVARHTICPLNVVFRMLTNW